MSLIKVYSCFSEFVSAQELKHKLDLSYINVEVYASLIRHIVACSFRLKDYFFGTFIKDRVRFMCIMLVSPHGLLFRYMD